MSDIHSMTEMVLRFRDDRNWAQFHTPKDCAIGLTLEASEVAELFLWKTPEEIEAAGEKWHEDLGDELSDVLYWVFIIAHKYDIDLDAAFPRKLKKSAKKYPIEKSNGVGKKYTDL